MKGSLLKVCIMLIGIIHFQNVSSQSGSYQPYKINDSTIVGFQPINMELVPEKPLKSIKRVIRGNLFENEKPITYSNNSNGNYCVSFIDKHYELNYLIIDKTGQLKHSIIFINPEFQEFNTLIDQMNELGYSFLIIDSPFGPVQKNISLSQTWFEAHIGKQGNDEFETILIFNDHFQLIATERGD